MNTVTYTDEMIIDALLQCAGIKAKTARMLGCNWVTLHLRIEASPLLQQAQRDGMNKSLDSAEDLIHTNIQLSKNIQQEGVAVLDKNGNAKLDAQDNPIIKYPPVNDETAKWLLKHKGKERGYTERTEVTGADGVAISMVVSVVDSNKVDED